MRRILIEKARWKALPKHGGRRRRIGLDHVVSLMESPDDLLHFDEALDRLQAEDATAAEIVKLRLFAGLSVDKVEELRKAAREWEATLPAIQKK
jgi:sirohydrochlorin ferrochelatase